MNAFSRLPGVVGATDSVSLSVKKYQVGSSSLLVVVKIQHKPRVHEHDTRTLSNHCQGVYRIEVKTPVSERITNYQVPQ